MISEASKTTIFLKYAKARINHSFAAECKISKGPSLNFDLVKEHQETALYRVKHGSFNHKIADNSYSPLPFDLFHLVQQPAYVVIFWAEYRGDKRISIIDIDMWLQEKQDSKRKSLTYDRACQISKICDSL